MQYIFLLIFLLAVRTMAQTPTDSTNISTEYVPKGLLQVEFGSSLEDSMTLLAANGYKVSNFDNCHSFTLNNDRYNNFLGNEYSDIYLDPKYRNDRCIVVENFELNDIKIEKAFLVFNSKNSFNYGRIVTKIISKKSSDESIHIYEKLNQAIKRKYRKISIKNSRLKKNKSNNWYDIYEFKDRSNKEVIAELKLNKNDKWISFYGEWYRETLISLEYISNLIPEISAPNPGLLKDAL